MIVMPRRSVTRFFIPLIDVLLLLFVIFLLMPIASQEELEERRQTTSDLTETVESLERELQRRAQEIHKLEDARASAAELDKLRAELEALRQAGKEPLHKRTAIHVIDIDGKTGDISYYETTPLPQVVRLDDDKAVAALLERHRRAAGGRELYYLFLYPRQESGYPTRAQERRYQSWFAKAPHSLREGP